MAFQTSSGSSEASSSTASASSSSATPNDSGGSNSLSPGSSIPFSFLIAFIALFLFFLGCGLGTRRVAFALRRGFGLEVQDPGVSTRRRSRVELTRPILWDILPKVVEGEFSGKWRHLHVSVRIYSLRTCISETMLASLLGVRQGLARMLGLASTRILTPLRLFIQTPLYPLTELMDLYSPSQPPTYDKPPRNATNHNHN